MRFIPYGNHCIDSDDLRHIEAVLFSSRITQGPKVGEFEARLAKYCQAKYAVAVSSGTAALHIACLATGLKKGDEAITSPITFVATPNAAIYVGAKPVFADIDYDTVNIDPGQIEKRITRNTKVILPVHFAGLPCDMERIYRIAKERRFIVIEDASHALGAEYKAGEKWFKVGSCRHSNMAIFSFHPVKHITTGEGGAITTNSRKLYEKLITLRSHGIHKDKHTVRIGPWYYEMRDLGFNYRISDFQSALGISQMNKLANFLKRRREIAKIYNRYFEGIDGIEVQRVDSGYISAWHLFILKIDYRRLHLKRQSLMNTLRKNGIGTQVHYIPVYRQPFYRRVFALSPKDYPNAERYYQRALSLPIYPRLKDEEVAKIIRSFKCIIS